MAGIYIPGMEKPKHWRDCPFSNGLSQCSINGREFCDDGCPLIPVPKHERLIDADALIRAQGLHDYKYKNGLVYVSVGEVVHLINAAPTIIPADKEGDNG